MLRSGSFPALWRLFPDSCGLGWSHLTESSQSHTNVRRREPGLFGLQPCLPASPQPCFRMAGNTCVHLGKKKGSAKRPITATRAETDRVL